MFCPDCGTNLDDVANGAPCPGCGGDRRSANANAGCATATGAVPNPRAVGHSHPPDGSERINVGSRLYRSSGHAGLGTSRQTFDGRPPRNEDDVLDVCRILRSALNASGGAWGAFAEQSGPVNDIDAVAVNDVGQRLQVQVVRVEQAAWKDLGRTGHTEGAIPVEELAMAVLRAVEKKLIYPPAQRQELLLALDAIRSPSYVLKQVLDHVMINYAGQIAQYGFRAVWLVGPTAALTYQLA